MALICIHSPILPISRSLFGNTLPWSVSAADGSVNCEFARDTCKKRGFCPSCGARRMAETAALLADEVFPDVPLRQWVISFPFSLRYLFAAHPQAFRASFSYYVMLLQK